ncbi:MAG: sugar transferase [Lentimicrobiaceae bacterium]|nr:sugar transferase [Lentimicrobiaceae bacterium]
MIKYCFDKIIAFLSLILLSPVLFVIAVMIKLKMPDGPIIFRQERIGKDAKPFKIYKFRTMIMQHDHSPVSVLGESRITPFGAFLRRYKLDCLPEFWNVLLGEMSLVGPRPDVPGYADKLEGENRRILEMKPGITGQATLKYKNEEKILAQQDNPRVYNDTYIYPDKVRINLEYVRNWRFSTDLKIIYYTLFSK